MMQTINIHKVKTHLSRLTEQAARGESFVIAKAGKPLVKIMALSAPEAWQQRRLGFMTGQIAMPEDFDRMGSSEIEAPPLYFRALVTGYWWHLWLDVLNSRGEDVAQFWLKPSKAAVSLGAWQEQREERVSAQLRQFLRVTPRVRRAGKRRLIPQMGPPR